MVREGTCPALLASGCSGNRRVQRYPVKEAGEAGDQTMRTFECTASGLARNECLCRCLCGRWQTQSPSHLHRSTSASAMSGHAQRGDPSRWDGPKWPSGKEPPDTHTHTSQKWTTRAPPALAMTCSHHSLCTHMPCPCDARSPCSFFCSDTQYRRRLRLTRKRCMVNSTVQYGCTWSICRPEAYLLCRRPLPRGTTNPSAGRGGLRPPNAMKLRYPGPERMHTGVLPAACRRVPDEPWGRLCRARMHIDAHHTSG